MATRSLITEYVKNTDGNYTSVEIHPITDSESVYTTTTQRENENYGNYPGLPLEVGNDTTAQETVLQSLLKTRSRLYELRAFKNVTINTSEYNIASDKSVPSSKILSHAVDDITTKIDNKYNALKTKIDDNKTNISKTNSSVQTNGKHINFLEHCCFPVDLCNKEIEYFAGMSDLLNANDKGNTAFINSELYPLRGGEYDAMQYDQFGYKISIFRGRENSEWIHETWNSTGNTFVNNHLRVTPGIILLDDAFFIRVKRYGESNEALELICHQSGGNLETFLSNYNIELTVGRDPHAPKGNTGFIFKNNSKCNFVIIERFKLWN